MNPYAVAFLAGLASLGLEVLLVRLLAFVLSSGMDFLAIPLALLGLAIGSVYAHFFWRRPFERLVEVAATAVPVSVLGSLVLLFLVFDLAFSQVHVSLADPREDARRLVVYAAILLPPFAAFGALFSALFAVGADRVGRLYAADLAGAAAGCVLAPGLLTWFGLPAALTGVVWAALLLVVLDPRRRRLARLAFAGLGALVTGLAAAGLLFVEHPDVWTLSNTVREEEDVSAREVAVRWNELARTALVRTETASGSSHYWVVQDNGLSNVNMRRYRPEDQGPRSWRHHGLAWDMGRAPTSVLTLFAGAGRDLMDFDQLSGGTARLVGVEINPAVRDLGLSRLKKHRLGEFYAKPNVSLVIQEGRDFLDHHRERYDLVYVANNGAVHASRTGHTRKFLDTREAMVEYLAHVAPGGMLLFANQPVAEKITSFTELLPDPDGSMVVFGRLGHPDLYSLLVVPAGLTPAEITAVDREIRSWADGTRVLYAPPVPGIVRRQGMPLAAFAGPRVTDDRPFTRDLGLSRLRLVPTAQNLEDRAWVSAWVKVFTVGLFTALSAAVGLVVLAVGRGPARVPPRLVVYLLLTGIGYMCVEIGLIARTELFVGKPLYAVALNLAVFLVSSAGGSLLADRRAALQRPLWLAVVTALAVAWGHLATGLLTDWLLSAPLVVKAVGVAAAVGPAGAALGAFYPYSVASLVREGRASAVPASYALTTLSSVLGSAFAATAIIEVGFSRVIAFGAGCYLVACAVAAASGSGRARATVSPPEVG